MSKTLLVAQREYVENLRTKTFWIGILLFPVIIGAFVLVNRFLARSKDQRTYAVVDYTQGAQLSAEIDKRSLDHDLSEFLAERSKNKNKDKDKDKPPTVADLRAAWREAKEKVVNPKVGALFDVLLAMPDDDVQQLIAAGSEGKPPVGVLMKHMGKLSAALKDFDAKEASKVFAGLSLGKYRRVDLPALGVAADAPRDDIEATLRKKVQDGALFAYFVLAEDPVLREPGTEVPKIVGRYVSNNTTDRDLRSWYASLAADVVRERQVRAFQVKEDQARALQSDFAFVSMSVSATGAEEKVSAEKVAGDWAPMGFVYLLWIAVFSIAQMLLTNTVEEKSNRIIEVLLSSVSAHQLMTGKILGIAATGLTMIGSWVVFALVGIKIVDLDLRWVSVIRNPLYLASFIGYFLAGYMIYAAVLVAIGSVCNSLKEAQNLMQPVILLLMVPLIAMVFVVQDPNGTVSRILTYVPIYTPFLMMNRAGGPPPAWEYVATTILIVATIAVSFWAAGRVFRVGVLMTGKPPKLREIVGWMMRPTGDATPVR